MHCACGGHLEFSQPCMSEKIGNNFFCIHYELKKLKITSLQNLYEKFSKLHLDIHYMCSRS